MAPSCSDPTCSESISAKSTAHTSQVRESRLLSLRGHPASERSTGNHALKLSCPRVRSQEAGASGAG